jgi:hypothetical protein
LNIELDFQFWLNRIFCGKFFRNETIDLIDKARSKIREDLDIHTLLNRINDVEKIKKVVFDQNQIVLFDFFPKPIIKIDEKIEIYVP